MRRAFIFCCSLVGACQSAEVPQQGDAAITADSNAVRLELQEVRTKFERWLAEGAVDSAATILTDDHSSLPPNSPAVSGRAHWIGANKQVMATGTLGLHHETV